MKCTAMGLTGTEFEARNTTLTTTQCLYHEYEEFLEVFFKLLFIFPPTAVPGCACFLMDSTQPPNPRRKKKKGQQTLDDRFYRRDKTGEVLNCDNSLSARLYSFSIQRQTHRLLPSETPKAVSRTRLYNGVYSREELLLEMHVGAPANTSRHSRLHFGVTKQINGAG